VLLPVGYNPVLVHPLPRLQIVVLEELLQRCGPAKNGVKVMVSHGRSDVGRRRRETHRPDVGREGTVRERFFSRGSAPDDEDEDEEGVEKKGEVISFVCRRVWGFCGEVCSSSSLSSSSRLRFSAVFRVLACWGRGAALTLLLHTGEPVRWWLHDARGLRLG
jgi:hypothetical protein